MHKVVMIFGGVIVFLSLIVLGRVLYGNFEPEYLARNVKNQLQPMLEIKKGVNKNMSKMFLTDALLESFQLTSDTYVQKMPTLKAYFIGKGYDNYVDSLRDIEVAARIQEGPLVLTTHFLEPPVVDDVESKEYDGVFVWVYYAHVLHTIRTPKGSYEIERKYKVSMQHLPLNEKPLGLAIYSMRSV